MAGAIMTSVKDNWCTPEELLIPVRKFFGNIDLDPCWNPSATTAATECFDLTRGQDGLELAWGKRRVFVNPPWGRVIPHWTEKAYDESYARGAGVVMLLPANTDTVAWQRDIFPHACAVCFLKGRITFIDPDTGLPAAAGVTKGAAFVYFGKRSYVDFRNVFGPYGHVIGRVQV